MTQQEIAARLQQLRRKKSFIEERDVTQAEVAADTALSVESFSRYENGKRRIPEDAIQVLARYYGVSPAFIRYGETPTIQPSPEVLHPPELRTHDGAKARAENQAKRNAETRREKPAAGDRAGPSRRPKPR